MKSPSVQPKSRVESGGDGIGTYLRTICEVQKKVIESQHPLLKEIAARMAQTVLEKKRIFVFGTGHSHMLAEEAYCRAGGIATVVPIFLSSLMLHESIAVEAVMERTPGRAAPLLERHNLCPGEMMFIYSNSGVNHLPIEMALTARQRGVTVVGVCSFAFSAIAPLSALGKRLPEVSDYAIDNTGVPGDAMVAIGDSQTLVGPSSTIVGATIWNALATEVARLLHAHKGDAPIFVSQNLPGGLDRNKQMNKTWDGVPPLT